MNTKVKLVESPTIWLLNVDSNCLITETPDIPEENQIELQDLTPNVRGKVKSTQTLAALQTSEKEQTNPYIMKVFSFKFHFAKIVLE